MRLRKPPEVPPQVEDCRIQAKNLEWHEFSVELITPMIGGGVRSGIPDVNLPVRPTEINHQLRFWWRLRKWHQLSEKHSNVEERGRELLSAEQDVWGAMSVESHKKDRRSKVSIRVSAADPPTPLQLVRCCEYKSVWNEDRNDKTKPPYITWSAVKWAGPRYALFSMQGESPKNKIPALEKILKTNKKLSVCLPKDIMEAAALVPENKCDDAIKDLAEWKATSGPKLLIERGYRFSIRISCKNRSAWDDILLALRAWACFGGIGARTRRGAGAIKVTQSEAGIVSLLAPIEKAEALTQFGCLLTKKKNNASADDPVGIWKAAVDPMYKFRQGEPARERRARHPGQSRWPEAASIRRIAGHNSSGHEPSQCDTLLPAFPRAAFGMPLNFKFHHQQATESISPGNLTPRRDPPETALLPQGGERMASPLILRPMANGLNSYVPIALLLPVDHLRSMAVILKPVNRDKLADQYPLHDQKVFSAPDSSDENVRWWPGLVSEQKIKGNLIKPLQLFLDKPAGTTWGTGNSTLPLPIAAFLDYFENS